MPAFNLPPAFDDAVSFPSEFELPFSLSAPAEACAGSLVLTPEQEVVGLFDELREGMLRYLCSLGLSAQDGEEIVQESFLLLFQHLRRGKPRHNLRGWVFRVARNLALKLHKKNRTSLSHSVELDEDAMDAASATCATPEDLAWSGQRQMRLFKVLRALPERDQSCLLLRAEGLRYREIASILEISLGSVAASVARALQRLDRVDRR